MYQRARIIDPHFQPACHIGREIWVCGKPFYAELPLMGCTDREVLPMPDGDAKTYDGLWFVTNLYSGQVQLRIWHESVELLARGPHDFSETVSLLNVNDI